METHSAPPPKGPTALKVDTKVMARPFAAPLWSWSWDHLVDTLIYQRHNHESLIIIMCETIRELPQLYFVI